jgi:PAS domain S-box-containing protein
MDQIISHLDTFGIIVGAIGAIWAFGAGFIKYVIKPFIKFYKNNEQLMKCVEDIKKELTTNGGSSIKDTVNRIDRRQVIIDKRSKAIFYNVEDVILEVDENGNIVWANQYFHQLMGNKNVDGLDWVTYIDEPYREPFIKELKSCSENNREFNFSTKSVEGEVISFSGFPYRDRNKNYGFLIFLKQEK